jgi:hypothetical protein
MMGLILGFFYDSPETQIILIMLFSLFFALIVSWKKPFCEKFINIMVSLSELIFILFLTVVYEMHENNKTIL